jgi:hypothetical protein
MAADPSFSCPNYEAQGGSTWVIGGVLNIASGGSIAMDTGSTFTINGVDLTAKIAALVANPVGGAAAALRIAQGVAAVTGTATVATGLTTVTSVQCTSQDDMDGTNLAAVSATVGNQSGAPVAGSVILKAWKITGAGNAALIAATAAKNLNWFAVGT